MIALFTLMGMAWAFADSIGQRPVLIWELDDLQIQVTSNTTAVLLQRWQYLEALRTNRGLTPQQKLEYCQISKKLGFKGAGCS